MQACYRYRKTHIEQSAHFALEPWVRESYDATTIEAYLAAMGAILKSISHWSVEPIRDDFFTGFMLKIKDKTLLLDCKIARHPVPLLEKEQTFALLKSPLCAEKEPYRVVLGKPAFDEPTKVAEELTVLSH